MKTTLVSLGNYAQAFREARIALALSGKSSRGTFNNIVELVARCQMAAGSGRIDIKDNQDETEEQFNER